MQLNGVWRNAFLTVQRIKERYARDSHRHVRLQPNNLSKFLIEDMSHKHDVIKEMTARRTPRVGSFNDHGHTRIGGIGNDKVKILIGFLLDQRQYAGNLKGCQFGRSKPRVSAEPDKSRARAPKIARPIVTPC